MKSWQFSPGLVLYDRDGKSFALTVSKPDVYISVSLGRAEAAKLRDALNEALLVQPAESGKE